MLFITDEADLTLGYPGRNRNQGEKWLFQMEEREPRSNGDDDADPDSDRDKRAAAGSSPVLKSYVVIADRPENYIAYCTSNGRQNGLAFRGVTDAERTAPEGKEYVANPP